MLAFQTFSGAVFGIAGLILGLLRRRRDPRWKQFATQTLFYTVLFAFMFYEKGVRINNAAHAGGLCAGIALGWLFGAGELAPARSSGWANLAAALGLLACFASLALCQLSPR